MIRIAELPEPYLHFRVARSRQRPIRAQEAVPPRKVEPEVAVGLEGQGRMMDPVHVWRHDEAPERAVNGERHLHVRVIEHRRRVQNHLEREDREDRRADSGDGSTLD